MRGHRVPLAMIAVHGYPKARVSTHFMRSLSNAQVITVKTTLSEKNDKAKGASSASVSSSKSDVAVNSTSGTGAKQGAGVGRARANSQVSAGGVAEAKPDPAPTFIPVVTNATSSANRASGKKAVSSVDSSSDRKESSKNSTVVENKPADMKPTRQDKSSDTKSAAHPTTGALTLIAPVLPEAAPSAPIKGKSGGKRKKGKRKASGESDSDTQSDEEPEDETDPYLSLLEGSTQPNREFIWRLLDGSKCFSPFSLSTHPLNQLVLEPLTLPGLEVKPSTTLSSSASATSAIIACRTGAADASGSPTLSSPSPAAGEGVATGAGGTTKEKKPKRVPADRRPTSEFFRSVS